MPLTPAFTASQSGLTPGSISLTDTSSGSDVAITQRRVYFQAAQGTYLVQSGTLTDYEPWSYADASKVFAVLPTDQALSITVQWLDVSNTVLYTLTQVFCFPQFLKNFFYYLIQQQALTPNVITDRDYVANLAALWTSIIGAIAAIEVGADVAASQNCLDRGTAMQNNQSLYFQSSYA